MKIGKVTSNPDYLRAPPAPPPRPSGLRDAFNASAAAMDVMPSLGVPAPMSLAALTAAAATAVTGETKTQAPAGNAPQKNIPLFYDPVMTTGIWLLNGLLDNSYAAAIMRAAAEGDAANLSLLLTKHDTLPDFVNANGLSPAMAAAVRGQAATLEILASHPLVNLGRADPAGQTALHLAAQLNQREAVAILLKHHAPFDLETAQGHIAFDLGDAQTQAVFLQDKNFKRFLKQRAPDHPLLQPPPVIDEKEQDPPPETEMDADEPEDGKKDTRHDALFTALTGIGLSLQKGATATARAQLNDKLAEMTAKNLSQAHHRIKQTGIAFDWDEVFVRAAGAGNTAAMVFLQDAEFFGQRTLNRALWEAAATGQRDAAHHLMLWEADPAYAQKSAGGEKISAIDAAWQRGAHGVIEEMALWSDVDKTESAIARYLAEVRSEMSHENRRKLFAKKTPREDLFMPLISLSAMQKRREELAGAKPATLTDAFARVAQSGNITEILAVYAEAQRPRFLRGKISFDAAAGGSAMGWALVHDHVMFARKLAADGYKLSDAPPSLQHIALQSKSAAARDFAKDNLSGRIAYPRIEDTGKRPAGAAPLRQPRTGLFSG
jgi:hypothetical protein